MRKRENRNKSVMRIVINIVLVLAIVGLSYALYTSIAEPIQFRSEWRERERAVSDQLKKVRDAQIAYKGIVGEYAHSFDTLEEVLRTGEFKIVSVIGDPDDPNKPVITSETLVPAADSMATLGINIDSLRYVPYTEGQEFEIDAKVLDEYQNAKNIPVVQVGVRVREYMGKWKSKRFNRYDDSYDPNSFLKFGDMGKPSTNGNWRE